MPVSLEAFLALSVKKKIDLCNSIVVWLHWTILEWYRMFNSGNEILWKPFNYYYYYFYLCCSCGRIWSGWPTKSFLEFQKKKTVNFVHSLFGFEKFHWKDVRKIAFTLLSFQSSKSLAMRYQYRCVQSSQCRVHVCDIG